MKFTIAGFYAKAHILNQLLTFYQNNSFMFRNEIKITSLYDSLPYLKWSGGRIVEINNIDYTVIFNNIKKTNNLGIGVNIVFTNFYITKSDLFDKDCNKILEFLSQSNLNGVIVASTALAKYIKLNYPKIKIILSLTYFYEKNINIIESFSKVLISEECIYDTVVLPPDYNKSNFFHNYSSKEKIEILVNETCYANCPFKQEHYSLINKDIQNNTNKSQGFCKNKFKNLNNNYQLMDKFDDLELYKQLGIDQFKIAGRTAKDDEFIIFLGEYLIKETYQPMFMSYFKKKNFESFDELKRKKLLTW